MKKISYFWFTSIAIIAVLATIYIVLSGINGLDISIYKKIFDYSLYAWGFITVFLLIGMLVETLYLKSIMGKLDNDQKIEFWKILNSNPNKLIFINSEWNNNMNLGLLYFEMGKIEEARPFLEAVRDVKSATYATYFLFIIAVYDNNEDDINYFYNKLQNQDKKIFSIQQGIATEIIHMIETKEFSQNLFESTSFEIVRDICLRYRKY